MRCPEVKQAIYTYLDGQLSSQVERAFFAHLSNCPSCQRELNMARQTNRLLESYCTAIEPPPDFTAQVMEKIALYEAHKNEQQPEAVQIIEALPQQKKTGKNWFGKIQSSGSKLARVASYAVLIVATGAFLIYNNTPQLLKISFKNDSSVKPYIDTAGLDTTTNKPNNSENNPEAPTLPESETQLESPDSGEVLSEAGLENESDHENEKDQPSTEATQPREDHNEATGAEAPVGPNDNVEKTVPNDVKPSKDVNVQPEEEIIPPPPRLDGPVIAASIPATAPTRSLALTSLMVDDFSNVKPNWNSGDKVVTYLSNKEAQEGSFSLWSLEMTDKSTKLLSANATQNAKPAKPQTKSPNGKREAQVLDGQVVVKELSSNDTAKVTPKLSAERVTTAWAPDGKTLAISVKSKNNKEKGLWLAKSDGSSWNLELGTSIGGGEALTWSPDGQKIAFTDGQNTIYILLLGKNSAKPKLLQVVPKGDDQGAMTLSWSQDCKKLIFDWAKPDSSQRGIYLVDISE